MPTTAERRQTKCPACGQFVDGDDNYCRRCGCVLRSGIEPVRAADPPLVADWPNVATSVSNRDDRPCRLESGIGSPASSPRQMRDNPWIVVALLFLVLGPFGLPILWASRGFGRPVKVVLTTVILGIGVYGIWYMYQAYVPLFDVLEELNRV